MPTVEAVTENGILDQKDVLRVVKHTLPDLDLDGKKVLLLIPDDTRTCPLNMVLSEINREFKPKVAKLDFLIALGTHAPMSMDAIYRYLELDEQKHREEFSKTEIFNHLWADPNHLKEIGTISPEKMKEFSEGRLDMEIPITVNKMIYDYDLIVIVGPTFPHEVVGFSGANKYFFPGIAGQRVIDSFHWLGALITNREINGTIYTPVRAVVDYCASLIDKPTYCFSLVATSQGLHGIFAGPPQEAYKPAAELSSKIHIRWCPRAYHTVLSIAPPMYPELWTAAKCMYKLEPVVENGGTLIIYAPELDEISVSHEKHIREIGYHTLPYFTAQFEKYQYIPWGVIAHSTHVKGMGTYENGVEIPNVNCVLATKIPEEVCRQINLGYIDPASIKVEDYENREDEGILCVHHAGEVLHKLESQRL
jgi:nickel-dependent lactate racemase